MKLLQTVNFFDNRLIKLPATMSNLEELREINVAGNKLKTLPNMDKWVHVERIAAMWNKLVMLPSMAKMTELMQVQIYENLLSDIEIGVMDHLEEFDANKNDFETIPDVLQKCTSLERLNFRSCRLKSIPDWLARAEALEMLNVGNNDIDSIPDVDWSESGLQFLFLDGNKNLHELPESLTTLTNITRFDLRACSLNEDNENMDKVKSALTLATDKNGGWIKF